MKVLYAVQATGNGHISRAQVLVPILKKFAQVDVLVSGTSADLTLEFPVKYKYKGLSFVFGKKGGVNLFKTLRRLDFWQFYKDVIKVDLNNYDLIINDFEPVSAWAGLIRKKHVFALSHQYSLLSDHIPRPVKKAFISRLILKYYAPAKKGYGFHFNNYDKMIFKPIIKTEFLIQPKEELNHYVVYLPAFSDKKIISVLRYVPKTNWVIFSKNAEITYMYRNFKVFPLNKKTFNEKLVTAKGIICGAGFETPAEALYLNKKLLVVPMKNQYEQQCNAEALSEIGVPVIYDFDAPCIEKIKSWVRTKNRIAIDYTQNTDEVVKKVLRECEDSIGFKRKTESLVSP